MIGVAQVTSDGYLALLRSTASQLRRYSELAMGRHVLERAVEDEASLAPTRRDRTVVFLDIRGFTAWSERQPPEEVVRMLNAFYGATEAAVAPLAPIRIKYTADEALLVFAEPGPARGRGRGCARRWSPHLAPFGLSAGFGIHAGPVIEGMLGSESVKAFDVLGDTVNVAKRLCDAAAGGEILVSEGDARRGPRDAPVRELRVKGKAAAASRARPRHPMRRTIAAALDEAAADIGRTRRARAGLPPARRGARVARGQPHARPHRIAGRALRPARGPARDGLPRRLPRRARASSTVAISRSGPRCSSRARRRRRSSRPRSRACDAGAEVLDLGTGSGAIAVTLACERPAAIVLPTELVRGRARRRARQCRAPWRRRSSSPSAAGTSPFAGRRFDLVVANPPYVAAADHHLAEGDLRFEPRGALTDGSADGLDSIRAIVSGAPGHLKSGGWLLIEHGYDQARGVPRRCSTKPGSRISWRSPTSRASPGSRGAGGNDPRRVGPWRRGADPWPCLVVSCSPDSDPTDNERSTP